MTAIIEVLKSVLLGIVEGITEWLPISSTGHMILVDELFTLNVSDSFKDLFFVVIQLGAILAVIILFWNKIWPFHKKVSAPDGKNNLWNNYVYSDKIILWVKILIASVPAAIIGFAFDDMIDEMLTGKYRAIIIASTLIIYGILFIIIESIKLPIKTKGTDKISYKQSLLFGVFQALAIIPGTSRSGSTILGGRLLGCDRETAAEYSFFMSIPAMLGGSAIKTLKFVLEGQAMSTTEILVLAVGTVVAFLVSVFAIKFLMSYIKKHDFKIFGIYRIILGIIVLIWLFLGD